MPEKGTKSQKEIFKKLTRYFGKKGYKNLGFGRRKPTDDSYKFGIAGSDFKKEIVCCYVQFVSNNRPWKYPPESMGDLVEQNEKNEKEFLKGNKWFWPRSRQVFIISGDKESYNRALRLIDTIHS
ncbi:MAG: hypothetical protein LiPW39_100 [Parcubacteria group bacterium LiPW_39]|nr:MAG: hypothetical protein LiPW39_100 [Parcubacteria group bacterium LiPW_39]